MNDKYEKIELIHNIIEALEGIEKNFESNYVMQLYCCCVNNEPLNRYYMEEIDYLNELLEELEK
jgi:hypothetical protein